MGITTFGGEKMHWKFFWLLIFSSFISFAQCPTVTNPNQSFCDTQTPTVANLAAVNNGGGVAWYASQTSSTPLSSSTLLSNGGVYYADSSSGTCSPRPSVTVTIYSAPTGSFFQGVCVATLAEATFNNPQIQVFGNNIQWYASNSSPTPLPMNTILSDNTIYYASQTNPETGCQTSRLPILINVGVVPTPTGPPVQQFCLNPSSPVPTVADLVASGENNWYLTADFGVPLNPSTPLINGTHYFATTVDPPCESPDRLEVIVALLPLNNAGNNGSISICQNQVGSTPPFNLYSLLSGSPDINGTWSGPLPTSNGYQGTVNVSTLTLAGSPYTFTYTANNGACVPDTSTVTITILPLPTATFSSNTTICSGSSATVTFTGTPNSTVVYTVNGGANQTVTLNASGTATVTNTYTTTAVFSLVSISSSGTPSCTQPLSGTLTVTVLPLPMATIASNVSICSGTSATVTFSGTPNATVTYTLNGGANQTITLNAAGTATITNTYSSTAVFALVSVASAGTPSCVRPLTGSVTITVIPPPTVTISGNANVCPNGQATVTFTGTSNATVTYTVNGGANQTITLNNSGLATITTTYSVTTIYSLVSVTTAGTPACSQPRSGSVTITVLPLPTATIAANATVCSGSTVPITFTGTPGATVTYTVQGGPNQTITIGAGGIATISATVTVTTVYSLVSVASSGTPSCSQPLSGTVAITVVPPPTVTISSSSTTLCSGTTGTVTFTGTANATVTYNINGGANQTIVLNGSGTATLSGTYSANTTINLVSIATAGTPSCSQPATGSVTFTVITPPTASASVGSSSVCSGSPSTITFTGTANATVTYTINNGPNQTIVLNGSGTAAITNTFPATTTITLVSVTTAGTPACTQPLSSSVTITVLPLPTVTIASSQTICVGNSATVTFTGTPNAVVTYNINGGASQTITLNASGTAAITNTYSSTTIFNLVSITTTGTPSCSQPQSGSVTITVLPPPTVAISGSTTVCSGGTATVTFTGTANAVVTYTANPGGQQTITLNASGTATISGTYTATTTYTLNSAATGGTPSCVQPQTGSITVNVIQLPVVTISGSTTVCPNTNAVITFSGTPNAIVTYTVNGGANQTITLNGSGTSTVSGSYSTNTTFTLVSIATTGTPSCSQPASGSAVITILPLPTAAISSNSTICSGETATITFTGTANAIVTYNVNGGAAQTISLDASGSATITAAYSATTVFTLVSASTTGTPGCSQPVTGSVTITVIPPPTVAISGSTSICPDGSATITFTGTAGAIVTYTINSGAAQTITLNASGTATITGNYSVTTIFEIVSISTTGAAICTQPVSGSATVTVLPVPVAAISATTSTICSGTTGTINFTGTPGAIVTYTANTGPQQNITLSASGTGSVSLTLPGTTTFTLVSVANGTAPACPQPLTGSVTITVNPAPSAGNDVANLSLCSGSAPVDLFTYLGATAQPGGSWSPALASGSGIFNPSVDTAGTYTYTVSGAAPCTPDTASVTVSLIPPPNAGANATLDICSNANPMDLFELLGNSAQTAGTWSPALASGTGVFNPAVDAAGTYTYIVVGTAPCANDTATVVVGITPGPDAGQDGSATLCANSAPQDLFTFLNGTPQAGGTWSPALASGTGLFDPSVDAAGVYTYTFFGNQPCDNDTAAVTVTVNPVPDAGTDGTAFFCSNYAPSDLFENLGGTPQPGGTWSPALASGTGVFNPLVDAPGVYTYTIGGGLCSTATASVTVSVVQSPNAGGNGAPLQIDACQSATSVDLTTGLNGQQGIGTWNDNDATGALSGNIFNASAVGPGAYHFTYTVGGGVSPCLFDTATVTVTVDPQPESGNFTGIQSVCASQGTFDLTALLDGTQQAGGVWTDSANATIDPVLDLPAMAAGTFGFTYTITNACGTEATTVQLTLLPTPQLAIPNLTIVTPICLGDSASLTLNGMTDGNYTITYNLSGANTTANQTATVTVAGGTASFDIAATNITNTGITTITFVNIVNTATGCSNTLSNVLVNFVVNPLPNLENVNLTVANACEGSGVTVVISGSGGLNPGNYQFNYTIPQATPSTGSTGIVTIAAGSGQFDIPASYFTTAGNYTVVISGIVSLTAGCSNLNEDASANFTILAAPDVSGATASASDSCVGFSNDITISGADALTDGNYDITYQVSGANTANATAAVTFANGSATFTIPATVLPNAGTVIITISQFVTSPGACGADITAIAPITFNVSQLGTPELLPQGNEFCSTDNPTFNDLSANINGTQPVVWYDAATGGTAYSSTDPLQNGATYYAAFTSTAGCESNVRLEVTTDLTVCTEDILIPDGFSPNGDNINDEFVIVNLPERYPNFKLEIYNRYGNVLYKGNINTPNWDGKATEGGVKMGSNQVPVGVYFYILEFNDGTRAPKQGRLYLSR